MHDPRPETIAAARADELVLMLFEGAVRFGREAVAALDAGDDVTARQRIVRVQAILAELDGGLDRGAGPVGRHLAAIYDYLMRRLTAPDAGRDAVLEVVTDIETLADAWAELVARRAAELAAV